MYLLIPGRKRSDVKNSSLTNPSQIFDEWSFPISSKDGDEIKPLKKLGERGIQRPFPNEERGHSSLIDGEDLVGVESLFGQLQNSRISHHDRFGLWKGLSHGLKGGQGQNKVAQRTLMNYQDGLYPGCLGGT